MFMEVRSELFYLPVFLFSLFPVSVFVLNLSSFVFVCLLVCMCVYCVFVFLYFSYPLFSLFLSVLFIFLFFPSHLPTNPFLFPCSHSPVNVCRSVMAVLVVVYWTWSCVDCISPTTHSSPLSMSWRPNSPRTTPFINSGSA